MSPLRFLRSHNPGRPKLSADVGDDGDDDDNNFDNDDDDDSDGEDDGNDRAHSSNDDDELQCLPVKIRAVASLLKRADKAQHPERCLRVSAWLFLRASFDAKRWWCGEGLTATRRA